MEGRHNILIDILLNLNVKYTARFTNKLYNEHPFQKSFYGLSKMLNLYGIQNAGVKIENKEEDLHNIELPFVVLANNYFYLVYEVTDKEVKYLWEGLKIQAPIDDFLKLWSGYTLLLSKSDNSKEINYRQHYFENLKQNFLQIVLLMTAFVIILLAGYYNAVFYNLKYLSPILLSLIGAYVCYLILEKKLHISNEHTDKICSLLKEQECNNILESKASTLFGIIGLGEIGFGYFIANILLLTFYPDIYIYLVYINFCSLLFTFWSIWYQKYIAKQWCILCLLVLGILWLISISSVLINKGIPGLQIDYSVILVTSVFLFSILTTNYITRILLESRQTTELSYNLNRMKSDKQIFIALLKKSQFIEVDRKTSNIIFGNPNGNILISILTNPHCEPCARTHLRIKELLLENKNICIQYIFSSFSHDLEVSARFLIETYFMKNENERNNIFEQWYSFGKLNKEKFFKLHPEVYIQSERSIAELEKHTKWKEANNLRATPTILVNGYLLPDNYKINDLKYISNISELIPICKG